MQYIFGRAIRRARVASNLTQQQLADKLEVTRSQVAHYEKQDTGVDELSFLRIAGVLDITPFELLGYASD